MRIFPRLEMRDSVQSSFEGPTNMELEAIIMHLGKIHYVITNLATQKNEIPIIAEFKLLYA